MCRWVAPQSNHLIGRRPLAAMPTGGTQGTARRANGGGAAPKTRAVTVQIKPRHLPGSGAFQAQNGAGLCKGSYGAILFATRVDHACPKGRAGWGECVFVPPHIGFQPGAGMSNS